ncbi:general stress protein [Georgenia faecalis]|uniref:general stress protein n=1 Tax=Georgenia faecalis TaxID=2483799 RepID=UPI000FDA9E76|nr:general stress protein [Georgenia faecalis]
MSPTSRTALPTTPTLPKGTAIASFETYLEAQKAVDQLSDREFPVEHTTIVGTDLRMVERITGRLTYPRVALAGAMSGAWFGLFVGLLFGLLAEGSILLMLLPALVIGAAFGMLFGLVSYAFTGGKRDFTSSSQVVAGRYSLLCEEEHAGQARQLLAEAGIRGSAPLSAGPTAPTAPPGAGSTAMGSPGTPAEPPRTRSAPLEDAHGNPLYGQRLPSTPSGEERSPE